MTLTTTLGRITLGALAVWALIIGLTATASAKVPPIAGSAGPAWITASDNTPRLYLRPVHSAAFASCEWVRVRASGATRWRALCG